MYLAHRLNVLGFEVSASLQTVLNAEVPVTFVDYILGLRHLGTTTYLKHMQQQRKQMFDLVKESGNTFTSWKISSTCVLVCCLELFWLILGLATLGENSELSPDTERTLRQCLRQLELLQTVWQFVLPGDVYSKSIGVYVVFSWRLFFCFGLRVNWKVLKFNVTFTYFLRSKVCWQMHLLKNSLSEFRVWKIYLLKLQ